MTNQQVATTFEAVVSPTMITVCDDQERVEGAGVARGQAQHALAHETAGG